MINFLIECSMCKDNALLSVIYVVRKVMEVIFIIVPIILIVLVTIDIAKNVVAAKEEDMRKNRNMAIKRIIYAVAIFFVPAIVNVVMNTIYRTVDDSSGQSFFACWEHATLENVKQCNEEAIENEKLADEKKKQDSDSKMSDYEKKVDEQNKQKQGGITKGEDRVDNNSNNGNSGDIGGSSSDGAGDTSDNYTIFVGDSRMVGVELYNKTSQNEFFVAKESMGVLWLNSTAYNQIAGQLDKHSNANVIVNIGVNDAANESSINNRINAYRDFCKRILSKYPDSRLIITNVGPVDESFTDCKVTNAQVNNFNKLLSATVAEVSGDTGKKAKYCEMSYGGYKTSDGIHYTIEYYQNNVYPGLKNCLNS